MEIGNNKRKYFPLEIVVGIEANETSNFVISKDGNVYKYLLNKIYFNDITQHLVSIMLYLVYINGPLQ